MSTGDFLRLAIIIIGIVILGQTILSLAKRQMTESFCIAWGILSVLLLLAGILLQPTQWNKYMSTTATTLILIGGIFFLAVTYFLSINISKLMRQNYELAIQVSLLNQENAMILKELSELTGKDLSNHRGEA